MLSAVPPSKVTEGGESGSGQLNKREENPQRLYSCNQNNITVLLQSQQHPRLLGTAQRALRSAGGEGGGGGGRGGEPQHPCSEHGSVHDSKHRQMSFQILVHAGRSVI